MIFQNLWPPEIRNAYFFILLKGKLFCMDIMDLDDGPILSVGNEKGELFVWEIGENQAVD
jgi:hypothetical protein